MISGNISILLIAHNEEAVIGSMIEGLLSNYEERLREIVVVDDASVDKTSSIVESWVKKTGNKVQLIKRDPPAGVGRAIKAGFTAIDPASECVLTMDSDFIKNIGDVALLIERYEAGGVDGVYGSRFIEGSRLVGYSLAKKTLNRMWHGLARFLFGTKQMDLTNNFKLLKTDIVRTLPWKSNGFAINAETGLLPIIAGYKICEVPVSWLGRDEGMGKSKFRLSPGVGWGYFMVILYGLWLKGKPFYASCGILQ